MSGGIAKQIGKPKGGGLKPLVDKGFRLRVPERRMEWT